MNGKYKAGDSIPTQIGIGIDDCDFVLLLLSEKSTSSNWVEREWQAKYWREVQENKVMVIPVLVEDCKIPTLLQTKKYADFRSDYTEGFGNSISSISNNISTPVNWSEVRGPIISMLTYTSNGVRSCINAPHLT